MFIDQIVDDLVKTRQDYLDQAIVANDAIKSLPDCIASVSIPYGSADSDYDGNINMSINPPVFEDSDKEIIKALTIHWVKETMRLFVNGVGCRWEPKPTIQFGTSDKLLYNGEFEWNARKYFIIIYGCPASKNCVIKKKSEMKEYISYSIECPEEINI